MKELFDKLDTVIDGLAGVGVKHMDLFSDDDGKRLLADIVQTCVQIRTLAKMSNIKTVGHPKGSPIRPALFGKTGLVKVRPCGEEHEGKTYLGIHIGDVALGSSVSITDSEIVCGWSRHNPGIYVPALDKMVYGCESWWGEIKGPDDLKDISDDDIENQWYVKAIMAMQSKEEKE